MPNVVWTDHGELLESMWRCRDSWKNAVHLPDLQEALRRQDAAAATDLEPLTDALLQDGSADDTAATIRLAALSRPAADHHLPGWDGYFVTEDADGRQLYSSQRFPPASDWRPVAAAPGAATHEPAATPDAAPNLVHDDATDLFFTADGRWYLPDQVTEVYQHPQRLELFYDADGRYYQHGLPYTAEPAHPGAPAVTEPGPDTAPVTARGVLEDLLDTARALPGAETVSEAELRRAVAEQLRADLAASPI